MRPAPHALALALISVPALADSNVAAEAMFRKGVEALEARRFDEACPAIAESLRLDPRPGTLYTLAECEELRGRVASASAHYSDYLAQTEALPGPQAEKHAERRKLAAEHLAALKPRVPAVTLLAPAGGPFEFYLDDTRLGLPMLGTALPADPGPHRWRVKGASGAESSASFELKPGQRIEIKLSAPQEPATPAASAPRAPTPAPSAPPAAGQRRLSPAFYATAGVGVVGLAVGTVAGLIARGHKATIDRECSGPYCSPAGLDAADKARSTATISTIGLAAGAAGAAAAGALWFFAPREAQGAALLISPGQANFSLRRSF